MFNSNGTTTLARSLVSGNTAFSGAEVRRVGSGSIITAADFNLFGHSGLSNDQAFYGFTPRSPPSWIPRS